MSRLASSTAMRDAATAMCVYRSTLLTVFGEAKYGLGSKFLTSAPMCVGNTVASNASIGPMPHVPLTRLPQNSSFEPRADTTPVPVTTIFGLSAISTCPDERATGAPALFCDRTLGATLYPNAEPTASESMAKKAVGAQTEGPRKAAEVRSPTIRTVTDAAALLLVVHRKH